MKTQSTLFVLGAFLGSFSLAYASESGKTFEIDLSHSNVGFTIKHLVSRVSGEFRSLEGEFVFDQAHPGKSKVRATVKADTIDTHEKKRDDHLKSADFFDVTQYPTLSFESKKFTSQGGQKYELQGNLTMHGVTRPITFKVDYLGEANDPWGNHRAGFTAVAKINRKDYGIVWNKALDAGGFVLSDEVELNINIEGIQKKIQPTSAEEAQKAPQKKS